MAGRGGRPECGRRPSSTKATAARSTSRSSCPGSPLEAVMSGEVWTEIYDRLTELIQAHHTTLVFVNTRRLAERVARQLAERLGEDAVTAHHGSLSKESRLDAEERLKDGRLQALVATARSSWASTSGTSTWSASSARPRRIATLLQRVGPLGPHRARHTEGPALSAHPRRAGGVRGAACARSTRGELDRVMIRERPLDVWRSRSSPRPPRRTGSRTSCSSWSAGHIPTAHLDAGGVRRGGQDAVGRVRHPAGPARRAGPLRRGERPGPGPPRRAAAPRSPRAARSPTPPTTA